MAFRVFSGNGETRKLGHSKEAAYMKIDRNDNLSISEISMLNCFCLKMKPSSMGRNFDESGTLNITAHGLSTWERADMNTFLRSATKSGLY